MKIGSKISILLLAICQNGWGQGFLNLNFESANPSGYIPGNNNLPTGAAFPGWTAYYSSASGTNIASTVYYDSVSAGGAAIFLEDSNAPSGGGPLPLQGNYSVLLEGASGVFGSNPTTASIGQTGTIPNTAQSLTFLGNLGGTVLVSFNGQPLSFMAISNTLNYTIWGADISAYAGQTGQLLFTATLQRGALLDDIQFSSLPVPEPAEFALAVLGASILGFHYRRNRPW